MSNMLMSKHTRLAFLGLGLAIGMLLAGLWPNTPLHAVATDRSESFLMATGGLDEGIEGVYVLDCLTGELRAPRWASRLPGSTPSSRATWAKT